MDYYARMNSIVRHYLDDRVGDYCTSMEDAWLVVEKVAALREETIYTSNQMEIMNISFKPSDHYLTSDGYPLGTTCWAVLLIKDGRRRHICAPTAQLAICMTVLWILECTPHTIKEFRQAFGINEPFQD